MAKRKIKLTANTEETKASQGIFTAEQAKTEHKHSPRLAKALRDAIDPSQPVFDFGCGKGEYIQHLKNFGYSVKGYEGTPELAKKHLIETKDVSVKMSAPKKKGTVICLEVIEHIEKSREEAVIDNLVNACSRMLILSWAVKGQGGCGHVNEQDSRYVIARIESEGFEMNRQLSQQLRDLAGADLWWFKKSIYVFDKTGEK